MKKFFVFLLAAVIALPVASRGVLTLSNGAYDVDTLQHLQVGPGTWDTAVRMTQQGGGSYPLNVFITQVDATNPYISFEAVLAKDSIIGTEKPTAMAKRKTRDGHHLIAGTNADFFTTQSTAIQEGTSSLMYGRPSGGVFINHEVATLQSNKRQSFVVDDDNRPYIGAFTRKMTAQVNGEKLTIYNVNYTRSKDKLTLFNHFNGARTTACTAGTEVLLSLKAGQTWGVNKEVTLTVEKVAQNNGYMPIPADKVVLSGNGEMATKLNALQVGDEVTINLDLACGGQKIDIAHGVGGPDATKYAQMLRDGIVVTDSTWASREPRTGIGYSVTRDTVIFCVIDGRTIASSGVTTDNEGRIMQFFGAYDAINLDGGGSSCMHIEALGGQVNVGSDGSERAVGDGFFAVCTAPEDPAVASLVPYEPTLVLPKYGYTRPRFYSYNQYGAMLSADQTGVQLSCDPAVGYFMEDSITFIALSSGDITATCGNASVKVHVEVDASAEVSFRLDSVLVDRVSDYAIEISGVAGGKEIGVLPQALTWTSDDPSVAAVDNQGVLNGLKNGMTRIEGTLGSFSDEMEVKVEIASAEYMPMQFTANKDTSFTSVRNIKIPFEVHERVYGCPDSCLVTIHTTAPIQTLTLTARVHRADEAVSGKYADVVPTGADYTYRIPLQPLVGTDQAIYPLQVEELSFALKDPKKNTNYNLQVKQVRFHYADWEQETALPEMSGKQPVACRKIVENGRIYILKNGLRYNILGTREMK